MLVLALESSTSAAKAILYDDARGTVATASERYGSEICRDGVTDTDGVYRLTLEMGRRVAQGQPVEAVGLCGTWHNIALCDEALRPSGGTYSWNYLAPAAMCRAARADRELSDALYRRTGCMPHATYMRQTLRYLQSEGVRLEHRLLPTQGGYNFYKMTGDWIETRTTMSGTGLLNIHDLEYDPFALDYAGITADQLGTLGSYIDVRPLNAEAAQTLGVTPGIPVVPAHSDGALNQLSSGAAKAGRMTLSVGTSGAIRLTTGQPVLPEGHELWCYYGVADYMSGAAINSACNAIDWFRNDFLGGSMDFDALDAGGEVTEALPVCLPFLFGERNPGWRDDRLGAFAGLRPQHTARDLYRALQAGILFNLYQCFERLAQAAGRPEDIFVSGGILHSKRWTQMAADIFDQPMSCLKNPDASTVGAAALALHAAGGLEDIRDFAAEARRATMVYPRREFTSVYRELYRRYLDYYERGGNEL